MRRTCYELINTHQPNYTCTRKVPASNFDRSMGSRDVLRGFPHLLQTNSGTVPPLGHDLLFPIYSNLTVVNHPIIGVTVSDTKGVITLTMNYKMQELELQVLIGGTFPSFLLYSFLSIFLAFTAYSFLCFRDYSVLISFLLALSILF
jgi:hypothetical protein